MDGRHKWGSGALGVARHVMASLNCLKPSLADLTRRPNSPGVTPFSGAGLGRAIVSVAGGAVGVIICLGGSDGLHGDGPLVVGGDGVGVVCGDSRWCLNLEPPGICAQCAGRGSYMLANRKSEL